MPPTKVVDPMTDASNWGLNLTNGATATLSRSLRCATNWWSDHSVPAHAGGRVVTPLAGVGLCVDINIAAVEEIAV